jgi:hypothetical protein
MWIDATVAASFVTNPDDSTVADKVGFALAPDTGLGKRSNWLWAWALAIPAGTQQETPRFSSSSGRPRRTTSSWSPRTKAGPTCPRVRAPRSTRTRTTPRFPFAQMTLDSILSADPEQPDGRTGALCGHPVRGDPGICGHRDRGEPGVLGSLCRSADRRRGAGERSGDHQRSHGSRGLP